MTWRKRIFDLFFASLLVIILGPILAPIFIGLGVHPIHFAIIMSVNLTVGLATPPMGLVLFVASSVSGERVETIARGTLGMEVPKPTRIVSMKEGRRPHPAGRVR